MRLCFCDSYTCRGYSQSIQGDYQMFDECIKGFWFGIGLSIGLDFLDNLFQALSNYLGEM